MWCRKGGKRRHAGTCLKWGLAVLALVAVIALRVFVFEVGVVSTGSMDPTIQPMEVIVINKLAYGCNMPRRWADIPLLNVFTWSDYLRFQDEKNDWGYRRGWGMQSPREGDVVIFLSPDNQYTMVVKRIHEVVDEGTFIPVDSIPATWREMAMREHVQVVNRFGKVYIGGKAATHYVTRSTFYDVRGDNTENSRDSRYFGPVNEEVILGKAGMVLWSWDSKAVWWKKLRWHRMFCTIK